MSMARSLARSIVRPLPAAITGLSGGGGGGDAYAVNGISPDLAVDLNGSLNSGTPFYRKQGSTTTLDAFSFPEPDGLRTMTDSSGDLVWNAHNAAPESDDLSGWTNFGTSDAGNVVTCSAGTSAHIIYTNANAVIGQTRTIAVNISKGNWDYISVTLQGNTNNYITVIADLDSEVISQTAVGATSGTLISSSLTSNADGSYTVRLRGSVDSNAVNRLVVGFAEASTGNTLTSGGNVDWQSAAAGTETVSVNAGWSYRSDLGGMADVPSAYRGISYEADYLPTTTGARYLHRFDDHDWDGTAWVNKGPLVERLARTNLDPNSDDLSAWTTSNTTIAKNQTGADGVANSAHSITAGANNGTALEQITASSADHVWGCLMKRVTGTGTVEVTVDGGSTWVAVTSDINSSEFVKVDTGAGISVTNPEFGVRLGTSGDVVAVQVSQLEQTSGRGSSPIPTTGTATARTADPALTVAAADAPYSASGLSLAVIGDVTYAQNGGAITLLEYSTAGAEQMYSRVQDAGSLTGDLDFGGRDNNNSFVSRDAAGPVPPGVASPVRAAGRYFVSGGDVSVQAAVNGAAVTTATQSPGDMPGVSSDDLAVASTNFMGHISRIVGWAEDIAEAGIEQASTEDNTAP